VSAVSTTSAPVARAVERAVPARLVLAAIVLVSTAAETLLARARVTPAGFPDEYLYSALARSLATTGRLRVHGVAAHFPALLVPVLTAPVWLVHDVATAYRLVQLENALVMSLAALPAYFIARRLGVGKSAALAVAVFADAGPQFRFVSLLQSEPFAYPLALAFVAAALVVVERPSLRAQIVFLALSGLVVLTRVQLAALPLCAVVALVLVALRERRLRAILREQWLLVGVVCTGLVGSLAVAFTRGFGFYHLKPAAAGVGTALRLGSVDAYIVVLGAGVAIVPAALVGLALAIARPRSRGELMFGVLSVVTAGALLLQSVMWGDVRLVQERYLGYILPLLGIGFALRCSRAQRRLVPEIGVAAAIAAFAALVPLSGYAIDAQHKESPVLYAFDRLLIAWHSPSGTAGVFALGATVLAVAGVALVAFRRTATAAIGLSLAAAFVVLVASVSYAGITNRIARDHYLPPDMHWVDHAARGPATMLVAPGASRDTALATLFWNPSLMQVVRLPHALPPDELTTDPRARIDARGVVSVAAQPVLVDGSKTTLTFRNASPIANWQGETLWRPNGTPRLSVEVINRLPDGRVLPGGLVSVWGPSAKLAGWIEFRLHAPAALGRAHLQLVSAGTRVTAPAGKTVVFRVRACGTGPWQSMFKAGPLKIVGTHVALPELAVPRYVADPAACR
jgi:hypothetical protein